jgi:hypothetical protein
MLDFGQSYHNSLFAFSGAQNILLQHHFLKTYVHHGMSEQRTAASAEGGLDHLIV